MMTEIVDALNAAAASWWPHVLHTTWQSSLVAAVLLVVACAWRRLSSPFRYALLLIVLAKFVMPPLLTAPTGLFSRWGAVVERHAEVTSADARETGPGGPAIATNRTPNAGIRPATSTPAVRGVSARPHVVTSDRIAPIAATVASPAERRTWLRDIHWQGWLMLLHGLGCLATGAWIGVQVVRLASLTRSAERVISGPLHDDLAGLSRRLRLGRGVRLLVSARAVAPMSLGPMRPAVIIPAGAIRALSRDELRAVVAHELAHHRRWDSWVNWAQTAVAVVWWFNPLVWLLHRALRSVREDCCDDLVLGRKLVTQAVYGEALLHLAEILSTKLTGRETLRCAHCMHPLGRRLMRVMDADLLRATRLSLAGCILVAVVGGLVLPGVSTRAEERAPLAAVEGPSPTVAEDEGAVAPPTVTLAGTVTDPEGNPLSGVRVRSHVILSYPRQPIFDETHTVTDAEGRFEFFGLRRWGRLSSQAPLDENGGSRRLVFEHPDYAITKFDAGFMRAVHPEFDLDQINTQLLDQTSFSGKVTDERGNPIAGAVVGVEVQEFREMFGLQVPAGTLSPSLWYEDPITADEEGRFVVEKLPKSGRVQVNVTHPGFAMYSSWNEDFGERVRRLGYPLSVHDEDVHVKLSPGATIHGRLLRHGKPLSREGVRIRIRDNRGRLRRLPWARTDREGRFELTGVSEGVYAVYAIPRLLDEIGLVATPRFDVQARAGSATEGVDLICTPGRVLEGRVVDSDNGRPLEDRWIYVRGGGELRLHLNNAETDAAGTFRVRLPPGACTISTHEWRDGERESFEKDLTIPSEGPLPAVDLAIRTRPQYPGRVVDEAGRPVPGAVVFILGDRIEADERGDFAVPEPSWFSQRGDTYLWIGACAYSTDGALGVSFWWPGDSEPMEPLVLRPVANVRGRVVHDWPHPVGEFEATIRLKRPDNTDFALSPLRRPLSADVGSDGTFEFTRVPLPAKAPLELVVRKSEDSVSQTYRFKYEARVPLADLKPGETRDLGDVVLKER